MTSRHGLTGLAGELFNDLKKTNHADHRNDDHSDDDRHDRAYKAAPPDQTQLSNPGVEAFSSTSHAEAAITVRMARSGGTVWLTVRTVSRICGIAETFSGTAISIQARSRSVQRIVRWVELDRSCLSMAEDCGQRGPFGHSSGLIVQFDGKRAGKLPFQIDSDRIAG